MNGVEIGALWTKRCHRPSIGTVVAPASPPVKKKVAWLNGVGISRLRRLDCTSGPSSSSPLESSSISLSIAVQRIAIFSGASDSDVGLSCRFMRPRGALLRCLTVSLSSLYLGYPRHWNQTAQATITNQRLSCQSLAVIRNPGRFASLLSELRQALIP